MVKLNADAAVAKTGNGGALAVVCRSEAGEFLGASALTLNVGYSPATLEAMACREALALAQDLNIQKICVASDCLEVIKNLTQPYDGRYVAVIREIKDTTTLFQSVVFKHEARASNGEAHRLARSSVSVSLGRRVWLLQPPEHLCIPRNLLID
jgi:ribonuclease HI